MSMNELKVGQWIPIVCYKHNGKLHRMWDKVRVLDIQEDFIVVANHQATVIESDGRTWYAKEPAITFFYKKLFYNIISMCRPTGIHYYCNLASPYTFENDAIHYIDYDLDVALSPNDFIRILDEAEYGRHRIEMGYSSDLDVTLRTTLMELVEMMKKRENPFQDDRVRDYLEKYNHLD